MFSEIKSELSRAWRVYKTLDTQTVVVLTASVALIILQLNFGGRLFFLRTFGLMVPAEWQGIAEWAWWFGTQGVTGFLIPVLILKVGFRQTWAEMGLGLGDWRLASKLALTYIPLVVVGTWVLSNGADFQSNYPHYPEAARNWRMFFLYEALFLFYWMGWEYLWRGFVQFGTARTFGYWAIFVQMIPFALLHADKPLAEAFLSILGGVALGALCWRTRSFWIAVPIHAAQMFILDLWCTLRLRTGASGIGWEALTKALGF